AIENLNGKRVAIIATDGFEVGELTSPKKGLEDAGAEVHIVSDKSPSIKAWKDGNWSEEYQVDKSLEDISANDFHALVIPGGVINPDKMRRNAQAASFVRSFFRQQKPVAAICHGPWLLAEAGVLKDRKITSFHSIKTDMTNAGARWVDGEVVVDEGLVTSRSPEDLDAFNRKLV